MSVSPAHAFSGPSRATDSRSRKDVVPIQTTRLAAAMASTVACGTSPHSACMVWASVSSARTGWKVPAPTCSVTPDAAIPASAREAMSAGVK